MRVKGRGRGRKTWAESEEQNMDMLILKQGRHFNFFLGGQIFFFQCHRKIGKNSILYVVI